MTEPRNRRWPPGLLEHLAYPDRSVDHLLESAASQWPERTALVFGSKRYTYSQLHEQADRLANGLSRLGIEPAQVVAIRLPNSPEFFVCYFAALRIGAIVTPCNPALKAGEMIRQLNQSHAVAVMAMDSDVKTMLEFKHLTPVRYWLAASTMSEDDAQAVVPPISGVYSLNRIIRSTSPNPPPWSCRADRDIAHLVFTGGTTGESKGVALTHANVMANTIQVTLWSTGGSLDMKNGQIRFTHANQNSGLGHWEYPLGFGEDTTVAVSPWFHASGLVGYVTRCVAMGATVVVRSRFQVDRYLADIASYQPTFLGGAPPLFRAVLDKLQEVPVDVSSVRQISSSSAPIAVDQLHAMEQFFSDTVVLEGYGLTEATMGVAFNPAAWSCQRKLGTVGLPFSDTEVKIMDPNLGLVEVERGHEGEVCVRGPQVMAGYFERPEATAEVIRDGWLYTGDIGRLDPDGYLTIVDRKKDLLIYKGYNVYPRELEEVLFEHPAVANCAVIGKPEALTGEIPKAFVVLKPGHSATEQELLGFVADRVAPYKRIRELTLVKDLPISAAGKVMKRLLREQDSP